YSAAVSSLNLRPNLNERWAAAVCGLLGTALALIFPADAYENFLLLVGSVFCPLFGVVLTDYFCFDRSRYQAADRMTAAYNVRGLLAWGLGCISYHGLQHWTALGSSLPSLVVSGFIYWLLMKFREGGHQ
ncbi:MAG: putative hydroxymethylpyrimidine transporter CytX, partial [Syntrophobacteraceae bacterium CG07_land_8_20_14_0_80_61_8]